jgi:dihydrofolate reductase
LQAQIYDQQTGSVFNGLTSELIYLTMRKLKLQVQMSVDGYIAGPKGEMDWMTWNWDEKLKSYVNELTESADTILMGRKMADEFISHWTQVVANPNDPSHEFGKKMMDTPKVVFTETLTASKWANTVLAKGDLTEDVNRLKRQKGKGLIAYGGASFDTALVNAGLIDELHLFVNPTIIGKGMSIFDSVSKNQNLKLAKSIPFECGIVVLCYEKNV